MDLFNLVKRKSDVENLNDLKEVQERIAELEETASLPNLGQYVAGTPIFVLNLNGHKDALKYIFEVINGIADPTVLPQHDPFNTGCPVQFWEEFARYFCELTEYCRDKDKKEIELEELKEKEIRIKEKLNIK